MTAPLTPAEQAAAGALGGDFECTWHIGCDEECHADRARAVVAAVEPHLTIAVLERTVAALEEFAASKHRAGHRRDALGIDEAAELVLDELRTARQALSRPTSEETDR